MKKLWKLYLCTNLQKVRLCPLKSNFWDIYNLQQNVNWAYPSLHFSKLKSATFLLWFTRKDRHLISPKSRSYHHPNALLHNIFTCFLTFSVCILTPVLHSGGKCCVLRHSLASHGRVQSLAFTPYAGIEPRPCDALYSVQYLLALLYSDVWACQSKIIRKI